MKVEEKKAINELLECLNKTNKTSLTDETITLAIKAIEQAKIYRDMEERLQKVYGKCDGLLEVVVQNLENPKVESFEPSYKARLLTDEDVDRWDLYKSLGSVEELEALKMLEKQGLLLKLPCKVGDTVYEISRVEPYRNPAIREMGVVDILLRDNDMYLTLQDLNDEYYDNSILSTEFGYTVFLTKEEAEQALKEKRS